ncbi:MAG: hypothetical protein WB870_07555 [Gallionellaceae bacterium]
MISAEKKSRIKRKLSQIDLTQPMKSRQSRIAKIEAGDPSVSLDLIGLRLTADFGQPLTIADILTCSQSQTLGQNRAKL